MKSIIFLLLFVGQNLLASNRATDNEGKYFKIKSYKVEQITEEEALSHRGALDTFSTQDYASDCSANDDSHIKPSDISFDEVVKIGKEVWKVIVDNKAVVEVEPVTLSVLPAGLHCWDQLSHWQRPKSSYFNVKYENFYGMNVIDVIYRVTYSYGGAYLGKGKYLANVSVMPASIDVSWGFKFSSSVVVSMATNLGSAEDPVAGVQLNINWSVKTLNQSQQSLSLFVDGQGIISQL